ncbi:hypothetical protein APP_24590 [Aeribacillus pallidus]|nr:hypothetical protein APP_24590 [Aeribacillus pallidus]
MLVQIYDGLVWLLASFIYIVIPFAVFSELRKKKKAWMDH